ncbi:MBL fold metallo-hydrolase [Natrarchaeobaculum aegyptiacum]|uniref:MBL fold metallo-hydrolase n=1 Tax=Natrarchaeobaculum aegyptiacum TaxID=745377 RepID=A0A2Z2HTS0_9EURY|nr:MBL fold metallo-hydrolase [Natrarchaeobaculum aegyptiacum]ARS90562.1 MBL fold metallo-hydrolase [Natrarchaeobaculum aegyptiacum]
MSTQSAVSVRLVRNATVLVAIGETTFLVDPLFASPGDLPPIEQTPNDRPNPLVPMPDVDLSHDAVVVTHRHVDHFDDAAMRDLEADVPLFCQPADADVFTEDGFSDVRPVDDSASFDDVTIHRTPGRHGHDDWAEKMSPVSGFVFEADRTVYLAGDTVWYDGVERTLEDFEPDLVVLNGGEARFTAGEPITMGVDDVAAVRDATDATVVVVHMEAINHCLLSRQTLRAAVDDVRVPDDGERVTL